MSRRQRPPRFSKTIPFTEEPEESPELIQRVRKFHDIYILYFLWQFIADKDHPLWMVLEDDVRRDIPRHAFGGCGADEEILDDIYECFRKALTNKEYRLAEWIIYLGYTNSIYFLDERYWRDWDLLISKIPLHGKGNRLIKDMMSLLDLVFFPAPQDAMTFAYIYRLVKEQRQELLIRFFRLSKSYTYVQPLVEYFNLTPNQIKEILEYARPEMLEEAMKYLRGDYESE